MNLGGSEAAKAVQSTTPPPEIAPFLSVYQHSALAFANRHFRVVKATIQTFQVGAVTRAVAMHGGPVHSLGGSWAVYGGLGVINQSTLNQFRTDIQLKLEDVATQERAFLSWSLPFALTISIDPGDSLLIFFARGGLAHPASPGDFRFDNWTAFALRDNDTGQIVPIKPLPTLLPPSLSEWALRRTRGKLLLTGGLMFPFAAAFLYLATSQEPSNYAKANAAGVFEWLMILSVAVIVPVVYLASSQLTKWQGELQQARKGTAVGISEYPMLPIVTDEQGNRSR